MGGQGITTHSPFPQRPDWRANASTLSTGAIGE